MLYHLTARQNVKRIQAFRRLESIALLSRAVDQETNLRTRRSESTPLSVGSCQVFIRDQAPLHTDNIEFEGGWNLEDLVADLNHRVFFWSGWERGPIQHGVNHFERYKSESPVILRVRFDSLREHNPGCTPLFCKFYSGSPRCYQGRRSLLARDCPYTPGSVVEVTFLEHVALPPDTEASNRLNGGWRPLFADHR